MRSSGISNNNYETVRLDNAVTASIDTISNDAGYVARKPDDNSDSRTHSEVSDAVTQGSVPNTMLGTIKNDNKKEDARSSQEKRRSQTLNSSGFVYKYDSSQDSRPMMMSSFVNADSNDQPMNAL